MQLLSGIGYFQLRFGALDFRDNLLFTGIQLCSFDVEPRFHYRGHVFFLRQTCLGPGLLDFGLRGFQSGSILRQVLFSFCFVKLDNHVALLHLGAVGDDLDNLKIAGIGWSGNRNGLHRLYFTSELNRVDELTTLHIKRGDRRRSIGVLNGTKHAAAAHQ